MIGYHLVSVALLPPRNFHQNGPSAVSHRAMLSPPEVPRLGSSINNKSGLDAQTPRINVLVFGWVRLLPGARRSPYFPYTFAYTPAVPQNWSSIHLCVRLHESS
jgi:hypothetical protein